MHTFGRNFRSYEFNNVEYSADVMLNNPRYEFNDFGCSSPLLFPTVPNFLPTTRRTEDDQTHTNYGGVVVNINVPKGTAIDEKKLAREVKNILVNEDAIRMAVSR